MKSSMFNVFAYLLSATCVFTFSSCSDDDEAQSADQPGQQELIAQMLDEVRDITAAYHDYDAAMEAGWDTQLSECVAHPELGGMGYHYARMEYLDGRVNHLEPQILLYAPDEDGNMIFVGVEYVVPFEILSPEADPPMLFFHQYHQNEMQGIWALHVWTEKENPSGPFFDWNPEVSCD